MADKKKPRQADWAPGTLERTRRAIGDIDEEEAKIMAEKLGGEVMYERSEEADNSRFGVLKRKIKAEDIEETEISENYKNAAHLYELPVIPASVNSSIDRTMLSDEYRIKRNLGLLNFIRLFNKDTAEELDEEFATRKVQTDTNALHHFVQSVKGLIEIAPQTYRAQIEGGRESKFLFLRMVREWNVKVVRFALSETQNIVPPHHVVDFIGYIRSFFHLVLQLYYYGEEKIPLLIREIHSDISRYPEVKAQSLKVYAREAVSCWFYIQREVIKRYYPLLMRMCSSTFEIYPDFYFSKKAEILKFTGLKQYDLLSEARAKREGGIRSGEEKEGEAENEEGKYDEDVKTGLHLLDKFFPEAGFLNLTEHKDMYPYFQPIYKFKDGFNLINPENPMQLMAILIRILEDLLLGCRNIEFQGISENSEKDTFLKVMDDWRGYREEVFENEYAKDLNEYVNRVYAQDDYASSVFGKKLLNSILYQTRQNFLPHFEFERLVLERPANESRLLPLYRRTGFVRKFLHSLSAKCDRSEPSKGLVVGFSNPWSRYVFDIPNEISKRMDVFLGASSSTASEHATNANLLKYTLCVMSVLDWWINNPSSDAYTTSSMRVYRISEADGKPLFSVPVRNDQNQLFAARVRELFKRGEDNA